jgi:hypothetical protein
VSIASGHQLLNPERLFSRAEILSRPCPIPAKRGVYAWYFSAIPDGVPTDGCLSVDGHTLLYVGISPKNDSSSQNLRKRITYHYRGNAEGSTLRLTLGVLLAQQSDFPLRRVGSGNRMTLTHLGEQWLDQWMAEHAKICWVEDTAPWVLEDDLLRRVSLPLNLQGNSHHGFSARLSEIRQRAKAAAREASVAQEGNQSRKDTGC